MLSAVAVLLVPIFTLAIASKKILLVGQIKSFDQNIVEIESGNRIYKFAKKELKFPSYKTGAQIEVELSETEFKKLNSVAIKK